jgi:hypothetical protein
MRIRFFLISLVIAGAANASDAAPNSPMAWPYRLLETAQNAFDEKAAAQAPGATLAFRLPKIDAARSGEERVEIVQAGQRSALPMVSATAFEFVPDLRAAGAGAMVVVEDRYFPKGEFTHPNVQVRSPGLPDGVRRMGDLRLACKAQVAMAKEEGFKLRAVLAGASLLGLDLCEKQLKVTDVDAPDGPYDTVTLEDGERRLTMRAKDANLAKLGDTAWSDNARITYASHGSD